MEREEGNRPLDTARVNAVIAQQDFVSFSLRFHTDCADRIIQAILLPILHLFYDKGKYEASR